MSIPPLDVLDPHSPPIFVLLVACVTDPNFSLTSINMAAMINYLRILDHHGRKSPELAEEEAFESKGTT